MTSSSAVQQSRNDGVYVVDAPSVAVVAASSARQTQAIIPCAAPGNMSRRYRMDIFSRLCESIEPGLGQNQGVYFTSIECSQSRAYVASDIHDSHVRPSR